MKMQLRRFQLLITCVKENQALDSVVPPDNTENSPYHWNSDVIIHYLKLFIGVRRDNAHSFSTRLSVSVRVLLLAWVSLEVLIQMLAGLSEIKTL